MTTFPPIPPNLSQLDHTPAEANAAATADQARRQRMLDKADQLDDLAERLVSQWWVQNFPRPTARQVKLRQQAERLRYLAGLSLDNLTGGAL